MALSEYLETMRRRHPRLSWRQMALAAGVSESVLYGLVRRRTGARPETLKAIADAWGTDEDYRQLMEMAGHPLPEDELTADEREVVERYRQMEPVNQRVVQQLMSLEMPPGELLDRLRRLGTLSELETLAVAHFRDLNDEDRQRALRYLEHATGDDVASGANEMPGFSEWMDVFRRLDPVSQRWLQDLAHYIVETGERPPASGSIPDEPENAAS